MVGLALTGGGACVGGTAVAEADACPDCWAGADDDAGGETGGAVAGGEAAGDAGEVGTEPWGPCRGTPPSLIKIALYRA
jgi:hypothetical protein